MDPMVKPSHRHVDVNKAASYAIIINALQIAMLIMFVLLILFTDVEEKSIRTLRAMAVITAATTSWGAIIDIRQAFRARRRTKVIADLKTTNSMMDQLNHTLRAQRHDFLNHLQVVYSLMEMEEYNDAVDYLERVYGEIRSVSSVLRTKSTAINALLQVKMAACQEQSIAFVLDITTTLEGMQIPAWEVCCILSNLLDNAIDAAQADAHPTVTLRIMEDLRHFVFQVENNGASLPAALAKNIFEPGVSSKGEGHGMGLFIVRKTLREYDGDVECHAADCFTRFTARVPKGA